MILPIILAGGSGSRLWPLSRKNYPKQFLKIGNEYSYFQETIRRLKGLDCQPFITICNEEHRFIVAEQIRELGVLQGEVFLEPFGKNTAPATAIAAIHALKNNTDPTLLILTADHVIKNVKAFQLAVEHGKTLSDNNKLVTFGILPRYAETGYGYIKCGNKLNHSNANMNCNKNEIAYSVNHFTEKPNLATATQYIQSKEYYWNSGMFMLKANLYLKSLEEHSQLIYSSCIKSSQQQKEETDFIRIDEQTFKNCPSSSIDYAIIEPICSQQKNNVVVVPLDAGWSDIGSFKSLWESSSKDNDKNVINGDIKTLETTNCLLLSEDKLITTIGIDNLVVVSTKDALLVANKNKDQEVKKLVNQLISSQRPEAIYHSAVYRPWGKYDLIDDGEHFLVKRITVKPKEKLSLQTHQHRSEHWIVVSGIANVTLGKKTQILTENQSIFIPVGELHSIENLENTELVLIEVQIGSNLCEKDIERIEDLYGRVKTTPIHIKANQNKLKQSAANL